MAARGCALEPTVRSYASCNTSTRESPWPRFSERARTQCYKLTCRCEVTAGFARASRSFVPAEYGGRGIMRRKSLLLCCALLLATVTLTTGISWASPSDDTLRKVGPELRSLYRAFRAGQQTGSALILPNPRMRVVEDRVVIDAVASDSASDLRVQLVALGMQRAEMAGRIVSGEMPIAEIPAMAALPSLRFARAAMTAPHGGGGDGVHSQ